MTPRMCMPTLSPRLRSKHNISDTSDTPILGTHTCTWAKPFHHLPSLPRPPPPPVPPRIPPASSSWLPPPPLPHRVPPASSSSGPPGLPSASQCRGCSNCPCFEFVPCCDGYRIDPKWLRSEPSGQTLRDVSARLENPGPIDVHLSLEKQKTFTCNTNRAGAYYKLLGFCFSSQLV